jgi:hypothetical protein
MPLFGGIGAVRDDTFADSQEWHCHTGMSPTEKRSPPVAIRYGKGLIGGALCRLLALLIHWIGINTIEHYRDDLLFYLQAHLILVLASMLAAPWASPPASCSADRTWSARRTLHAVLQHRQHRLLWPYWPSPSASWASVRLIFALFLASCCPSCATPTKA